MGRNGWDAELAELDRTLTMAAAMPRNLPSHVHAISTPARRAEPSLSRVSSLPTVNPRRAPDPPPTFGGSAYPEHLLAESPDFVRRPQEARGGGREREPSFDGFDVGLRDLDLRPSFPTDDSGEFPAAPPVLPPRPATALSHAPEPLAGPPPPAVTRRDQVRLLSSVPAVAPADHMVPLAPTQAHSLAEVLARVAEHAGCIQALLSEAATLLRALPAEPTAAAPEPTSTPQSANTEDDSVVVEIDES